MTTQQQRADREREWLALYAETLDREPEQQRPAAARPAGGEGEES